MGSLDYAVKEELNNTHTIRRLWKAQMLSGREFVLSNITHNRVICLPRSFRGSEKVYIPMKTTSDKQKGTHTNFNYIRLEMIVTASISNSWKLT